MYIRARVDLSIKSLDPTAIIVRNLNKILVTYGIAMHDLQRMKQKLPYLNDLGLILVQPLKDARDRYAFLCSNEMLVCIFPGFKRSLELLGLRCGYDLDLQDAMTAWNFELLAEKLRWKEARKASLFAASLRDVMLNEKVRSFLGNAPERLLGALSYWTESFDPQHAITLITQLEIEANYFAKITSKEFEEKLGEKGFEWICRGLDENAGMELWVLHR